MADPPLNAYTRDRVARVADDALRRAGVLGVLPTPIEAVQEVAGITSRLDITELSKTRHAAPAALARILGAFMFSERVIFIDGDQRRSRVLFTDAHEATHALCPWHEQTLLVDTEDTLFKEIKDQIEAEANYGASRLIFQGDHLMRRALKEQYSIQAPLALADVYGASSTATIRHYVREHPAAVALVVTGRFAREDGLPVFYSEESESFLTRFGRLPPLLPGGPAALQPDSPLGHLAQEARSASGPCQGAFGLSDADGTEHSFFAQTYFNQHNFFVMLTERSARLLGRRQRLVAARLSPRAA